MSGIRETPQEPDNVEDWVLVPKEPTRAMIEAAWRTIQNVPNDERMGVLLSSPRTAHSVKMLRRWRAMIAAAPTPLGSGRTLADANKKKDSP